MPGLNDLGQGKPGNSQTPQQTYATSAQVAAQQAAQAQADAQVLYQGTPYETTVGQHRAQTYVMGAPSMDPRGYMYGRDPSGAQKAIDTAGNVGNFAMATGNAILGQDTTLAEAARNRGAPVGDFGQQNSALGQSLGYGSSLAGLETTQGPSAAQNQLNMGTNQALASQLALARSGRGFGGNAAAMGLAQGNVAGIQANAANQSAMLRAQEDAAFRQRQAANFGNAAAIAQGAGTQFGQQGQANLNAYLTNQGQGDAASQGYLGQGATAFGNGINQQLAGQQLQNTINVAQMSGNQAQDDRMLRAWAAQHGYDLAQQQADAQQTAAIIGGVATVGGAIIGSAGGPAGAAGGAALAGAGANAVSGS